MDPNIVKTKARNCYSKSFVLFNLTQLFFFENLIWFRIIPGPRLALPLGIAAEQIVHYFWDYFSSSVPDNFFPEGVVLGL